MQFFNSMLISLHIIILLLFFFPNTANSPNKDETELWRAAKREFAKRTREYLQEHPISDELRAFIDEARRSQRRKRQDLKNMYAIKDGEVVPLERLQESLQSQTNYGENFTVVPLIIPIPLELNMTLKESTAIQADNTAVFEGSVRPILGRGQALIEAKNKKNEQNNNERTERTQETSEETVVDDLINDKLKSTSDANEIGKVLEDVQNLINAQKRGRGSNKDGALCNVTGYWDSEAGGVTLRIKKTDAGAQIEILPLEPPSEDGFIPQDKWNATVKIPFQQSAQVIMVLTAIKGRKVAIFLGECRICDGSETITGNWLIGRTSSSCKDQKASHSFLADVFRKNNVEFLKQAHLRSIYNMTTSTVMQPPSL